MSSTTGWLIGIEAEFSLLHSPPRTQPVRYLFFDPRKTLPESHQRTPAQTLFSYLFYLPYTQTHSTSKLLTYSKPTIQAFLKSAEPEIESATRTCGKHVIFGTDPDYVYYLLELKTNVPFSTKKHGIKFIETYAHSLHHKIIEYLQTIKVYRPLYMRQENKILGTPSLFPYGMSSRILLRNLDTDQFEDKPVITNTMGSYHITITLPFSPDDLCEQMADRHRHFANLVQWLEPLFASAFHSCDDRAVGKGTKYTRGSFRMVYSGWGNFGGSDLRKMKCPTQQILTNMDIDHLSYMEEQIMGRYSLRDPQWRNEVTFQGLKLLDPCRTVQKDTKRSSVGSDFRIRLFGENIKDTSNYILRSGIELRFFDWFHPHHLPVLGKILIMLAEQSRKQGKQKYVYNDPDWNQAVASVMTHGWKAILPLKYVTTLQNVLGIKFKISSLQAHSVFQEVVNTLFWETKDGEYTNIMSQPGKKPPRLPKINQRSWELAFVTHLMDHPRDHKKFNLFVKRIGKQNQLSYKETKIIYRKLFSQLWEENLDDILTFLKERQVIDLRYHKEGIDHIFGYRTEKQSSMEKNLFTKVFRDLLKK